MLHISLSRGALLRAELRRRASLLHLMQGTLSFSDEKAQVVLSDFSYEQRWLVVEVGRGWALS
ncbi:MAG: hypothetical protein ABDH66_04115 [Bacteroidia bacterium]